MTEQADSDWLIQWIESVASGAATMSQRATATVEAHGGLAAATAIAKARGVHLLKLTDDKGKSLIAASQHPFTTLC